MGNRKPIQEIAGALRVALDKARAEYGALARKVRWGDGPVYFCGVGNCAALGPAAGYAFETFPGWPVVAHPVEVFQSYGLSLLQPRRVLVMVSAGGEWPEAQELAGRAKDQGCALVVLAHTSESPLVKFADQVFLTGAEGDAESPSATVCMHAALNLLAFEAMRALKKPQPWWEAVQNDFDLLPEKLDWVFTQLPSIVRTVAAELARSPRLRIVGGGFYHYPAWQAAWRMRSVDSSQASAVEASEFLDAHFARADDVLLLLSGSHSRMKKVLHRCAAQARMKGARVLSLTDSNDRDLAEGSDLGIFIPPLLEAPASTLTLFVLEWLAWEALRAGKPQEKVKSLEEKVKTQK